VIKITHRKKERHGEGRSKKSFIAERKGIQGSAADSAQVKGIFRSEHTANPRKGGKERDKRGRGSSS